jgi:predicted ATPase
MELAISAGDKIELRLKAEVSEDDTQFTIALKNGTKSEAWTSPGKRPSPPLAQRPELDSFWPSVLLRFRAEALASPSAVVEGVPRLSFDGSGLPTLLAYLANYEPARLHTIVDSVRKVVPDVEDTRQRLRRWEPHPGQAQGEYDGPSYQYLLEVRMRGDGWVPADLLSEGTLFAFGMHAVLNQRNRPRMVILDDIDRGLHPKAQRALIQQLTEIADSCAGVCLIVSTHSPYILDEVPAEAVRVVRAFDGATQLRALVDHPEWQEWKSSMTSGEFWTYVGEDWMEHAP